jgi:hypothetical protein
MHGDIKKSLLVAVMAVLTCGLALAQNHVLKATLYRRRLLRERLTNP